MPAERTINIDQIGGKPAANILDPDGHLQVDVLSGGGGGTQYTVDDSLGATPTGTLVLAIRDDVLNTLTPVEGDAIGLRVDENGALWVIPSGTVIVDGSASTQPVSAASLPLPTGASTLVEQQTQTAHLAAIETAVQGTLTVDGSAVTQPVSGTVTANLSTTDNDVLDAIQTAVEVIDNAVAVEGAALGSGVLMQGDDGTDRTNVLVDTDGHLQVDVLTGGGGGTQYTVDDPLGATPTGTLAVAIRDDTLSSLTPVEGDAIGLRVDANGALWVIPSGTVTVDGSGVIQPVSAASLPLPTGASTEVEQQTQTAHLAAIETAVEGTLTVDGSAVTQPISHAALTELAAAIITEVQCDIVAELPAGDNNIGNVDVVSSTLPTGASTSALQAAATSHYRNIDANAEAAIKASAGTLWWIHAMNLTAAVAYLHLYDETTANVIPGTTTPNYTFPIPTQGDTNGAGFVMNFGGRGQAFANAITLVVTTTIDGSAGDPGTNGVFVNAGYS